MVGSTFPQLVISLVCTGYWYEGQKGEGYCLRTIKLEYSMLKSISCLEEYDWSVQLYSCLIISKKVSRVALRSFPEVVEKKMT